jgi:hypothetical protein
MLGKRDVHGACMRRDASRANGSVGEKAGGNNLNRCDFFETEKKNGDLSAFWYKILPAILYRT